MQHLGLHVLCLCASQCQQMHAGNGQPNQIATTRLLCTVQERGEGVGSVVGYSVRLESRTSQRTRLLFCTTG